MSYKATRQQLGSNERMSETVEADVLCDCHSHRGRLFQRHMFLPTNLQTLWNFFQ